MDDYIIDGDLAFSSMSSALKFYREHYHKKKEWVGLTPADRVACERLAKGNYVALWVAIEAKLKEKNT